MKPLSSWDDYDPGEPYASEWKALMQESRRALQKDIEAIVAKIQVGTATASEKWSLPELLANRQSITDQIKGRYTEPFSKVVNRAYVRLIKRSGIESEARGIDAPLDVGDLSHFKPLEQSGLVWFETTGRAAAKKAMDGLILYTTSGNKAHLDRFLGQMSQDKVEKYGETIIHNHLNAFYQQATVVRATKAGVTKFRYSGPAARRPFCSAILGKSFTQAEIKQMDNGQTGDVMTTCGGYNCRHRWVPDVFGDQTTDPQDPESIKKRLQKIPVGAGNLGNQMRGKVFIVQDGKVTNMIQRSVFADDQNRMYYTRYTGERQYLRHDAQGRLILDVAGRGPKYGFPRPPTAAQAGADARAKAKAARDAERAAKAAVKPNAGSTPSSFKELAARLGIDKKATLDLADHKALLDGLVKKNPLKETDVIKNFLGVTGEGFQSEENIRKHIHDFLSLLPPEVAGKHPRIDVELLRKGDFKGEYNFISRTIRLNLTELNSPELLRANIFHEFTHWNHIHQTGKFPDSIKTHFLERTKGERREKLEWTGKDGKRYGYGGSRGKKDHWYEIYAGKIYGGKLAWLEETHLGLEVPTRYMETIAWEPSKFLTLWNSDLRFRDTMGIVLEGIFP